MPTSMVVHTILFGMMKCCVPLMTLDMACTCRAQSGTAQECENVNATVFLFCWLQAFSSVTNELSKL